MSDTPEAAIDAWNELNDSKAHLRDGCEHPRFNVMANCFRVHANEDDDKILYFMAEFRVACEHCGEDFSFTGLPNGYSAREPMAGAFGIEARLPIVPMSQIDKSPHPMRFHVPVVEP